MRRAAALSVGALIALVASPTPVRAGDAVPKCQHDKAHGPHGRLMTVRPFPSIGTTFTDVGRYAQAGADVRPLMTFGPRPGLQLLFDLGPLSLFRLTRADFFEHSRVGFEVAYYHMLAIDDVDGVAGRNLRGRMLKVAALFEVRRLATFQLGASAFIRIGDRIDGALERRVAPGIHYAMGPEMSLTSWLSLAPMAKLEAVFDESFIFMVSLMLGVQFNI